MQGWLAGWLCGCVLALSLAASVRDKWCWCMAWAGGTSASYVGYMAVVFQ
jgi:hypothetical protein